MKEIIEFLVANYNDIVRRLFRFSMRRQILCLPALLFIQIASGNSDS